jgi:3-deoxy-D-manno-octulosonate 8-phosphate phosphatase (KDO 8-P phosphatase)
MKKEPRPAVDFSAVRLLLLDVDGVLTPGDVIYDDHGVQIKTFHVRDGLGIRMLMDAGIRVGIITGRKSMALAHRCENLGIDILYQGVKDKTVVLKGVLDQTGVPARETAYMGDDLPDLAVMKKVGIPIAVADACKEILECAMHITTRKGGQGAVREICEAILKAKGLWPEVIKRFDA